MNGLDQSFNNSIESWNQLVIARVYEKGGGKTWENEIALSSFNGKHRSKDLFQVTVVASISFLLRITETLKYV